MNILEDELFLIFQMLPLEGKCNAEKVSKAWKSILRPTIRDDKIRLVKELGPALSKSMHRGHWLGETAHGLQSQMEDRAIEHAFHHTWGVDVTGTWKPCNCNTCFTKGSVREIYDHYASVDSIDVPDSHFHQTLRASSALFHSLDRLMLVSEFSGGAQIPREGKFVANRLHIRMEYDNTMGLSVCYTGTIPLDADVFPLHIDETSHVNWETCRVNVVY